MQIHSVIFALSRQTNKQKYAKTISFVQVFKFACKFIPCYLQKSGKLTSKSMRKQFPLRR